jgi:hypothetical protein
VCVRVCIWRYDDDDMIIIIINSKMRNVTLKFEWLDRWSHDGHWVALGLFLIQSAATRAIGLTRNAFHAHLS